MALPECVEGVLAAAQVLVHIASTLVQASLGKSGQNGLQQCRVVALVVCHHHMCGAGGEAALEVKRNGPKVVPLLLLHHARLLLLARLQQPLVVLPLQGICFRVLVGGGHSDCIIPLVNILVHGDALIDLALREQQVLCHGPLLIEHCQLGTDRVGVVSVATRRLCCLLGLLHDFVQEACAADVSQGCVAALRDHNLVVCQGKLTELHPLSLRLRSEQQRLQHAHCALKVVLPHGRAELD
mmetsp:Transcript_19712/g.55028  ORF Transcript_19712/g.55028 Transcript_19712/m.55028 type:complete len:240 (-) Transcript_19712:1884-2603(-)